MINSRRGATDELGCVSSTFQSSTHHNLAKPTTASPAGNSTTIETLSHGESANALFSSIDKSFAFMACWKRNISGVNVSTHVVVEVVSPCCSTNSLRCGLYCIIIWMKEFFTSFARFPFPIVTLRVMKSTDTLRTMISSTLAFPFIRVHLILPFRIANGDTTAIGHGERTISLTTQAAFLSAICPVNHTRFKNVPNLLLVSPFITTSTRLPSDSSHPPCHAGIKVPLSKIISLAMGCLHPNSTVRHLKDNLPSRSVVKKGTSCVADFLPPGGLVYICTRSVWVAWSIQIVWRIVTVERLNPTGQSIRVLDPLISFQILPGNSFW
mmetsp:Transcript_7476/g.12534  ORF Transcript_7476/g.12534 Transcript_7476/m.12534 type:complete len:324 (+) Transcript_7476:85-1056(+)